MRKDVCVIAKMNENGFVTPLTIVWSDGKKYEIDKVIIGKDSAIPIKNKDIKFKPLKECSKVWFGITRVCSLEREGIDFGTFEIHSEITGKEKRFVDKYKDAAFLYYQVLPVIEPYHKDEDEHCNCLICR